MQWVQGLAARAPARLPGDGRTTGLMMFDFAYFREQTCLVACPYGRLSVGAPRPARGDRRLRHSARRAARPTAATGENDPNAGRLHRLQALRHHLSHRDRHPGRAEDGVHQLHPVHRRLRRGDGEGGPTARPDSLRLAGGSGRRQAQVPPAAGDPLPGGARAGVHPAGGDAGDQAERRRDGAARQGTPYTVLDSGEVQNHIRVKVVNRDRKDHRYTIKILDLPGSHMPTAQNPLEVRAGTTEMAGLFVTAPAFVVPEGRRIELHPFDGRSISERRRLGDFRVTRNQHVQRCSPAPSYNSEKSLCVRLRAEALVL